MQKSKVGRPPKYKNKEEIEGLIENYFKDCRGELLKNDDNEIVFDKYNNPVYINAHPPTITGLALALGFTTRQSLLNYQNKDEFMDTITRAKTFCEEYAERRLYDKEGSNGAKFSLANNFRGWSEKQEIEATVSVEKYLQDLKIEDVEY